MADVRIAQAQGERSAMLVAARACLNGTTDRSMTMLDQAEKFYVSGDKANAIA